MVNRAAKFFDAARRAVAVKREDGEEAPRITASGRGYQAEQIVDAAFENDVKVRKDDDLAQLLENFDVDSPIPLEALHAVGEILDYVYRYNNRLTDAEAKARPIDAEAVADEGVGDDG